MSFNLYLILILTVFSLSDRYLINGQHYLLENEHHDQFYSYFDESFSEVLPLGDSEFRLIQLETPINFYSEKYDHIYLNTNGILTFMTEFPEFLNQPFPLEYASIAPFYSNVDTTGANSSSIIIFFRTENEDKLQKASDLVRYAFADSEDFEATVLYIATWENVGYYNGNQGKQNSFQAVLICNNDETYVQFIYKKTGLNWLQADIGELGISDIRAQAGFLSEDGRYFTINGSGTENARFFNSQSNIGVPGVWVYRVGKLGYEENIEEPNNVEIQELEQPLADSCSDGLYKKCHQRAECIDNNRGFCCKCNEGFYGNGFSCIDKNIPLRVTGSISGTINGQQINDRAKIQAYIVMTDGRSYTAITPINSSIGHQLKLVLPLGLAISWLFAKPIGTGLNGYQLTGGVLHHYSTLLFKETGEKFYVNQTFEGLNYWDQLAVKIDVAGRLPDIEVGPKVQLSDFIEEYEFISDNKLRSISEQAIELPSHDEIIEYRLEQLIVFKRCLSDQEFSAEKKPIAQKNSKVTLDFSPNEQAIRMSILSKVGVDPSGNPCLDGTSICGYNTICKPTGLDAYECGCENGYILDVSSNEIQHCVDIDECRSGYHICDENAECENNGGGYTCTCFDGYEGNGYECKPIMDEHLNSNHNLDITYEHEEKPPEHNHDDFNNNHNNNNNYDGHNHFDDWNKEREPDHNEWNENEMNENDWHVTTDSTNTVEDPCEKCSPNAFCQNGICHCEKGFIGDGIICLSCKLDEQWVDGRCIPAYQDVTEVQPLCDENEDCTCPEGYEFIYEESACRFVGYIQTIDFPEDQVSCEYDFRCHQNASCEFSENLGKHICMCLRGFIGDGFNCLKTEVTCRMQPSICHEFATCEYDQKLGRSECVCNKGYMGDGNHCEMAPECYANYECPDNAYCDQGVCICDNGFERDLTDNCVPIGTCGLALCSENAVCKLEPHQHIQYCECLPGYAGDGLTCTSIPLPCNVKNNCGLHASCVRLHVDDPNYECVCDSGFNGDGILCLEEPNCRNTPNICDPKATCEATEMGLMCICPEGFLGNGTNCKEITRHEFGFLLISQGLVIIRVPFNSKIGKPISLASMAIGLDKDCVEGRVYWGDIAAKKIMSIKYDGTDSREFITENLESPEGIAIDWISRRLYWTDSDKDTIEVANLDNPQERTVLIKKHLVNPRGIAVDPFKQKLYWSDWNRESPKIEMSNLDGTERRTIVTKPELILPNSLVVIPNSDELCYADAGSHKIQCIDLSTDSLRTVAGNLSYPFGLANTDESFYWTDWTTKQIESVDLNGHRKQGMRISVFGSHKMFGMTAVTDYCPNGYNPCKINNGGCTDHRICLPNNRSPSGKGCKCTKLSKNCDFDDIHHHH